MPGALAVRRAVAAAAGIAAGIRSPRRTHRYRYRGTSSPPAPTPRAPSCTADTAAFAVTHRERNTRQSSFSRSRALTNKSIVFS